MVFNENVLVHRNLDETIQELRLHRCYQQTTRIEKGFLPLSLSIYSKDQQSDFFFQMMFSPLVPLGRKSYKTERDQKKWGEGEPPNYMVEVQRRHGTVESQNGVAICSTISELWAIHFTAIQAYLVDIVGSTLDHHNKARQMNVLVSQCI